MVQAHPITVYRTEVFTLWHAKLRDLRGREAIERRIRRLSGGNFGDAKSVGDHVSELRVDVGPGYRVYFTRIGDVIIVLLCGGDKSSQSRDIVLAKSLAASAAEMIK